MKFIGMGLVERVSEGDFGVGNVFSHLGGESVVADDDLQFIIT